MSILARFMQGQAAAAMQSPMGAMGAPQGSFDLGSLAVEGAARPDGISGLDSMFRNALESMIAAAPENIRAGLTIGSGYRSVERQAELWDAALKKYGDPEIADNWVARPGKSNHNRGLAADLKFASPEVKAWVHANAGRYGLHFPMSWEPWHIELRG